MITGQLSTPPDELTGLSAALQPVWLLRGKVLWKHRRLMARVAAVSLVVSLAIAFVIPKRYKSTARIMPPDQSNSGALVLAALASRSSGLGSLGSLAGGLLGGRTSGALFMDLLRSATVTGHLIDRFDLQRLYHNRYRFDTAKRLARNTTIADDKKSGVITISVEDTSPVRARDMAQAYLDELNRLVTQTSTSTARRERVFIENRLHSVEHDLEQAQIDLSDFSSRNNTVDIREQGRAMVDASARLQGELLVAKSGLQSLRQVYGDGNVRVRQTEARISELEGELRKMAGSATPLAQGADQGSSEGTADDPGQLYPPLRRLPRLAVPYADLYRRTKVQETVFELLTQQYEMARIDEAKDVPVVSVIDPPGIPEKKSFPPRLFLALALTLVSCGVTSTIILLRESWLQMDEMDPRKLFAAEVLSAGRRWNFRGLMQRRGWA
jgi:uncharacterized protein involved in exopolysaccharide biosynthesis